MRRGEDFGAGADLALARKEREDGALVLGKRAADAERGLRADARLLREREERRLDGEHPPLGADDRRAAEVARDRAGVERRGHDEDAQVGAERALDVEREREAEVGVERALVELVEDHEPRVGELRVREDAAREEPLREDEDARLARGPALEPDVVADETAEGVAREVGHPPRRGARGHPARLEEEDRPSREPRFVEERERDGRRLARAGRRDENRRRSRRERAAKLRQGFGDRQAGEFHGAVAGSGAATGGCAAARRKIARLRK